MSNFITGVVVFDDWAKRPKGFSMPGVIQELQQKFEVFSNAQFNVVPPTPIPGLGNAFGFQMEIEDRSSLGLTELQKALHQITARAESEPGFLRLAFSTFSASSPQVFVDIDRLKVKSLGVTLNDVFQTLQAYMGSSYVNLFNKFNQSFQVRIQADRKYRLTPEDIGNLYVENQDHQMVPLGAVVSTRPTLGTELVTRYNLYPAATLTGVQDPRFSSGEALNMMGKFARQVLPAGMDYEWTGLSYQEKLIGNQAYLIFALSITLVFLVLAAQYESWTDPAVVILVVPMSLVGIVIGLFVRKFPNDLYTQIGLVLMIALAAKNAILVVEFARDLRAEGMSPAEAAIEASRRRFRPIIMTSIAFILGVVPLVTAGGAGAASQQSLGTVVFGGMIASTVLAIPFVPVFYVLIHRRSELAIEAASKASAAPAPAGH